MSDRNHIAPDQQQWRRLSYTCRCGWVDWGHALPDSAQRLKRQMDSERPEFNLHQYVNMTLADTPAYLLVYGQAMGIGKLRVSTDRHYVVRKSLSQTDRERAALAIFLQGSFEFEQLQGSFPFSILSGESSFSPEDMISDIIGFYSAFRLIPEADMRQLCGEVSVAESYRIWDRELPDGFSKLHHKGPSATDHQLSPIYFPSQECSSDQTTFPPLFSSIQIAPSGTSWVQMKSRFIDRRFMNARKAIRVDRQGVVRLWK